MHRKYNKLQVVNFEKQSENFSAVLGFKSEKTTNPNFSHRPPLCSLITSWATCVSFAISMLICLLQSDQVFFFPPHNLYNRKEAFPPLTLELNYL